MSQLAKVPLFSDCSQRDLQTIARVVHDIAHEEGTVIAREGEPGIGLFVIAGRDGRRLDRRHEEGHPRPR